ncbi:hypothetical protein M8J75_010628 [Diaphorina citri]|nr:hypothetical protein M8J75_010628 [Diaphorina citri]
MFASWWIFIMILTAFYTANLTAFLTLSQFTLPIHSVEDIANPTNTWCAEAGGAVERMGDLDVLDESLRRGRGQFIDAMDRDRIMQLISNGVLFLHDKHWLNFFMLGIERAADEMNHCQYVLTTDIYLTRSLSFVMLSYVESGIIKHLLTKDLPEAVICPLDLGSKERQLSNPDLITTYIVVVSGFTAACFVLLGERMLRRMCRGEKYQTSSMSTSNYLTEVLLRNSSSSWLRPGQTLRRPCSTVTEYYVYKNE